LQKNLAGKVSSTYRGEFLGSAAMDGSQHKTTQSQCVLAEPFIRSLQQSSPGFMHLWLSSLLSLAGGPFRGRPSRRGLTLQRHCWLLSVSGRWGCRLSYLSCFWWIVAAPPARFPSCGLPWFFLCFCRALRPSRQTLPCASVVAQLIFIPWTENEISLPALFQPLRPRRVTSHCWVITIVLSSESLDPTGDLGGRRNALSRCPQPALHSTALLSKWDRPRGVAEL